MELFFVLVLAAGVVAGVLHRRRGRRRPSTEGPVNFADPLIPVRRADPSGRAESGRL